ncbi:hypothetical protein ND853_13630 [Leptospira levettii]|nr:hypothetical protein [Leptospira levettii]
MRWLVDTNAIICAYAMLSVFVIITNDSKLIQIPDLKVKSLELSVLNRF